MSLGRPAIRAKERRHTMELLRSHAVVMQIMIDAGIIACTASEIAYDIVTTTARRQKIWRTK
jgi:hypothetical protein